MKDPKQQNYREKEAVAVDLTEDRFRRLRAAYLEGRITVNSQSVAEKLLNFERSLDSALKAAAINSTKEQHKKT